jgi:hypothetical protein
VRLDKSKYSIVLLVHYHSSDNSQLRQARGILIFFIKFKLNYFPVMVLFEALRQSYLKVIYLKYSIFILLFFNEG